MFLPALVSMSSLRVKLGYLISGKLIHQLRGTATWIHGQRATILAQAKIITGRSLREGQHTSQKRKTNRGYGQILSTVGKRGEVCPLHGSSTKFCFPEGDLAQTHQSTDSAALSPSCVQVQSQEREEITPQMQARVHRYG